MKEPVKPEKPTKPYPPNKDQKVHRHNIDVEKLFIQDIYFDGKGNEISFEEYEKRRSNNNYNNEYETEHYTPSLKSLIDLVPIGIDLKDIFINLSIGSECPGIHPITTFDGAKLFYETPFIYEVELEKYNQQIIKYNDDLVEFKRLHEKYEEKLQEYKVYQKELKLKKKKADLENQLKQLTK